MGLFAKKCEYCRNKIDKGHEHFEDVKLPGYLGTFNKPFCSEAHATEYVEEINNRAASSKGGCC